MYTQLVVFGVDLNVLENVRGILYHVNVKSCDQIFIGIIGE